MDRKIFIASSAEGLPYAAEICDLLKQERGIQCLLWPDIFAPGSLTFEALEEMLMDCCAAVFVATPDDPAHLRDQSVLLPRANVMLEFGLVAGRLGRHNTALCIYGCAQLPSDLAALTVIRMPDKKTPPCQVIETLVEGGKEQLRRWVSRTLSTAERVPRTEIVHGYTGTWDFEIEFDAWRCLPIRFPSYAHANGSLTLWISADGECGAGNAQGRLAFKFFHSPSLSGTQDPNREKEGCANAVLSIGYSRDQPPYIGEFRVAHEMQSVECQKEGGLRLCSRVHSLHQIMTSGQPLPELEGVLGPPEPWLFEWNLKCAAAPRLLEGTFGADPLGGTHGKVTIVKRHSQTG